MTGVKLLGLGILFSSKQAIHIWPGKQRNRRSQGDIASRNVALHILLAKAFYLHFVTHAIFIFVADADAIFIFVADADAILDTHTILVHM